MNSVDFPPLRRGKTLHTGLIIVLLVATVVFVWLAARQPISLLFTLYVILAGLFFFPIPFLIYRSYALAHSNYSLDRDKLAITWGLRAELIPISNIEWVRPLAALTGSLPLPFLRLPGSVLGVRHRADLGEIEFLASDASHLLLVATARHVFAISPFDQAGFIQNIQRAIEMGSLSPAASQSIYPSFVVVQAWESLLARYFWLAGLFLNIGLLVWVGLMAPALNKVTLGFLPSGQPRTPNPGLSLILLPVVSLFFYLAGWVTGLILYRREDRRSMAQIVWAGGVVASLLFLVAAMIILITPV
jgi:hypothetical protein